MLNIMQIQEILPHRYPFLLVDKIEEYEPNVRAVGYKNVSINEYFFQGHFPQEAVMPGVLIIEALAQVGAVAILSSPENKGKLVYFAGIDNVRFKRKVVPGDTLKLEVEIIKQKGPIGIGKATAWVGENIAAQGELTFAIQKN
jgi:3-hydroxyacyl-[acyl-carrier-protein] dehydratase